jgi:hypothetical protein
VFASLVGNVIVCVRESCWTYEPLFSRIFLESLSFVFTSPVGLVIFCVRESFGIAIRCVRGLRDGGTAMSRYVLCYLLCTVLYDMYCVVFD